MGVCIRAGRIRVSQAGSNRVRFRPNSTEFDQKLLFFKIGSNRIKVDQSGSQCEGVSLKAKVGDLAAKRRDTEQPLSGNFAAPRGLSFQSDGCETLSEYN